MMHEHIEPIGTTEPTDGRQLGERTGRMLLRGLGAFVLVGVSVGALSMGIAEAATAKPIDIARQRCLTGIDRRTTALATMSQQVAADTRLTPAHATDLNAILGAARGGIAGLRAQVAVDADAASLRTHCLSVVNDFRVFALIAPQVHLTRATDAANAVKGRLTDGLSKIDGVITKAEAAGKDVTKVKADRAPLGAAVTTFDSDLAAVPAVTGIGAAQFNTNHGVLDDARTKLKTVRNDGKAAREAARVLRDDLRQLRSR